MASPRMLNTLTALAARNLTASIDKDGDVVFKRDGKTWIIFIDDADPTFFRIALPNFWPIEDEDERQRAFAACSHASCAVKVAKVFVVNDNIWASAELLLPDGDWTAIFDRCLDTLDLVVSSFISQMRKTAP